VTMMTYDFTQPTIPAPCFMTKLKIGEEVQVQIENSEPSLMQVVELRSRGPIPPAIFARPAAGKKVQIVQGVDDKWYVASAH
jgi:hypothetical protein